MSLGEESDPDMGSPGQEGDEICFLSGRLGLLGVALSDFWVPRGSSKLECAYTRMSQLGTCNIRYSLEK